MMVKAQETAEQKLLKMIEATSGVSSSSASQQKKVDKKKNIIFGIKLANKILILFIVGILVLIGMEINAVLNPSGDSENIFVEQISISKALRESDLIPRIEKLSHYLSGVKRRNILSPYEETSKKKTVKVSGKNRKIITATQKYRLVGISWLGDVDSASVMLEDTETKITHFLQKGEKIGDVIVKTIYAESVELGYESEEIIIRYDKSQK